MIQDPLGLLPKREVLEDLGLVTTRHHGARLDGVTDDATALEAAGAYAATIGRTLVVDAPIYVGRDVTIPDAAPVQFQGAGAFTGPGVVTFKSWGATALGEINATEYGADPTGVRDSVPAINRALQKAAASIWPQRVVVPRGRYRTAGQIVMGTGASLEFRGAVLVPDATPDTHLIRGQGALGAELLGVELTGVRVDGTNKPATLDGYDGGWGQVRFDHVKGLRVRDCEWRNVHSCLVMQNVQDFQVRDLQGHDLTDGVVTLFTGTKRGTVANLLATNASELMDFYNNEDVTVANVVGTGQVTPEHMNEAFDVSTSRRISICNVVVRGFARGARVKSEAGQPAGQPAWEDISFSNMTILDSTFEGINAQASEPTYSAQKNLRISNVTIRSAIAGASGILASPSTGGAVDARIEGCSIDVPGTGITAYGWTGLVVANNRVVTASGRAIDVTLMSTHGAEIVRNVCTATGGTSSEGAIFVQRSDDVKIHDNRVASAQGSGIRFTTGTAGGARPSIRRNVIESAGYYGIYCQWSAQAQIDLNRGGDLCDNDVRDWGLVGASRAAIYLTFGGITGTLEGLNVCGNTGTLHAAAANGQSLFAYGVTSGAITLNRCRLDSNTAGSSLPATPFAGQAAWGAGCTKLHNFPDTP